MTIKQALNALPILQKLMELKLPFKKAYQIYSLTKVINDQREFFIKEEEKLINKFNGVVKEGRIFFPNEEDQKNFFEQHNVFTNETLENIESVELNISDLGEIEFMPIEIMALNGVVNFK